ncbi:hypothetical protein E2C01_035021 [Portunus trituberculatus]|uniref:DUF4772 domain-containing protein n=1 Tax=Portunus trituberculatus TaxID=210409 RepID=A0A5B7F327_PORTR|nr:hypothetical protein [Portunus trituberculatus]
MSTGKRLAKRSILGTRVACCLEDGKYYAGVICAVKTMDDGGPTVYSVRVEGERRPREVRESDLVGSGFTSVGSVKLRVGQRAYITHNNREVCGTVLYHRPNIDEVLISVTNPEFNEWITERCEWYSGNMRALWSDGAPSARVRILSTARV